MECQNRNGQRKRRGHCAQEWRGASLGHDTSAPPVLSKDAEHYVLPVLFQQPISKILTTALYHAAHRFGVGKWRLIQKDEILGPQLINRSNVDLKVFTLDPMHVALR